MGEPISNPGMKDLSPFDGLPALIEAGERAGAREIVAVAGTRLPTRDQGGAWDLLLAEGGTQGDLVEGDELFRVATLPEGWSIDSTGHAMWSKVRDADGYARLAIFYKAAFYDRRAQMSVVLVPTTSPQEATSDRILDECAGGRFIDGVKRWGWSEQVRNDRGELIETIKERTWGEYPEVVHRHRVVVIEPDGNVRSDEILDGPPAALDQAEAATPEGC